jgi:siroheme synthase-like protein
MDEPSPAPYPVVLRLQGQRCVVFGSGHEAEQKSAGLEQAGAEVIRSHTYDSSLIEGACLVVAAGPNRSENPRIFADCVSRGILINCLDDPPYCRFTFPSIHRQGDLTIAVSTNGACPALAVRIRETLGQSFGPEYATFLAICRSLRQRIKTAIPDFDRRRDLWYRLVESPALDLLRAGNEEEARILAESLIARTSTIVDEPNKN